MKAFNYGKARIVSGAKRYDEAGRERCKYFGLDIEKIWRARLGALVLVVVDVELRHQKLRSSSENTPSFSTRELYASIAG